MGFLQTFTLGRGHFDDSLVKADRSGHKYISKRPNGAGSWIYKYRNPETGEVYEHGDAPVRDLKQWHATLRGARSRHTTKHAGPRTPAEKSRLEHLDAQIAHVKKLLAAGHTHASDTSVDGDGKEKAPPSAPEKPERGPDVFTPEKHEDRADVKAAREATKQAHYTSYVAKESEKHPADAAKAHRVAADAHNAAAEAHEKAGMRTGAMGHVHEAMEHGQKARDFAATAAGETYSTGSKEADTTLTTIRMRQRNGESKADGEKYAAHLLNDLGRKYGSTSEQSFRSIGAAFDDLGLSGAAKIARSLADGKENDAKEERETKDAADKKANAMKAYEAAHHEAIEATKTAEASQHTYDTRAAFHDEAVTKRLAAAKAAVAAGKDGLAEVHRAAATSHQMKAENIRKEKEHSETGSLTQLAKEGHSYLRTRAAKLHEQALASKSSKEVREASKEIRSAAHASSSRAQEIGRYSTTTHSASAQENANALHRHADTLDQHAQKLESRERAAKTRDTNKTRETATQEAMQGEHKPGTAKGKEFFLANVEGPKKHTATAIHGDYAAHEHAAGAEHGYSVTHIPTGMSVSNSINAKLSKEKAVSLARHLHQHAPGVMGTTFNKPVAAPGDVDKIKHGITQWGASNYGAKKREPKAAETARPDFAGSLNRHIDKHNKETKAQRFAGGNYLKDIRSGKQGGEESETGDVKKAMERATHENEDTMSKSGFDMLRDIANEGREPIAKADAPAKRRAAPPEPTLSKAMFDYDPTIRAQFRMNGDEALQKGLYKFAPYGDRKMDSVPDEYLVAYLDAFIEEAYEQERAEPAHKNPTAHTVGGDTASYFAKFVFNELVSYIPCNSNLKRAAVKLKVTESYIADRLRSLASTSPMSQAGTFHGDFTQGFMDSETENSLAATGVEGYSPFAKGMASAHTRNMIDAAARAGATQDEVSDLDYARARLAKGEEYVKLEPEVFVPVFDEFPNPFDADTKLRVAPDSAPSMYDGAGFKS